MTELLTVKQTLQKLGISRSTLYRWEEEGKISALRTHSNQRRFKLSDIENLIDEWAQPKQATD